MNKDKTKYFKFFKLFLTSSTFKFLSEMRVEKPEQFSGEKHNKIENLNKKKHKKKLINISNNLFLKNLLIVSKDIKTTQSK